MKPIRTKERLLYLATVNAPTAACAALIREHGASVFRVVTGPEGFSGWVVSSGKWLIGIWADEVNRHWTCTYPTTLPGNAVAITGERL